MRPKLCRTLCVDDNEDTCEVLTLLLTQHGHTVATAPSVAEALRLAASARFDLYILDAWLLDGSGVELCRRLREIIPPAPIIFYSGVACDTDRATALSAGAQAYIAKPYINQLLDTVQSLLLVRAEAES